MGLVPGILPGPTSLDEGEQRFFKTWGKVPIERGKDAVQILEGICAGEISTLILLGEDPLSLIPDRGLVERALATSPNVIALDKFVSSNLKKYATVVLPVPALGERQGSHINIEGRISPLSKIISSDFPTRCEWEIALELADQLSVRMDFTNLEGIWEQIQSLCPQYASVNFAAIENSTDGILPTGDSTLSDSDSFGNAANNLHVDITGVGKDNYSHRLVAQRPMYDGNLWQKQCDGLKNFFPDTKTIYINHAELTKLGISSGANVEVVKMQDGVATKKISLVVQADAGIPNKVAVMKFSPTANGDSVCSLIDSSLVVNDVLIQGISSQQLESAEGS